MTEAATVAAISTPTGVGGLAVLRISGPDAIKVADRVFRPNGGKPLSDRPANTLSVGAVYEGETRLDTVVASLFHAPHSYTGEDVVELSCHGGVFCAKAVLRAVLSAGASMAGPGEFTKRAFLNGKLSLTQAEAVMDVIRADSDVALKAANAQLTGALYRRLFSIREALLSVTGHLAAWADYPEEDMEEVTDDALRADLLKISTDLSDLLAGFDRGQLIREGIDTVIVGRPNVGKSTLMNLLARCERSIVTPIAGTTRDVVEESVRLGDWLLRLADTAGLRDTQDPVEKIGVERTRNRLESAALVLAVFDGSAPLTPEDEELCAMLEGKQAIVLCNKQDLPGQGTLEALQARFEKVLPFSATEEGDLPRLTEAVGQVLELTGTDWSAGFLANERQRQAALSAKEAVDEAVTALDAGVTLDAVDVLCEDALASILSLTGERVTETVTDQVFSRFCVGK